MQSNQRELESHSYDSPEMAAELTQLIAISIAIEKPQRFRCALAIHYLFAPPCARCSSLFGYSIRQCLRGPAANP
jgi:hypothetical protein